MSGADDLAHTDGPDTHRVLDEAVHAHLQPDLRSDGEVIVAWLVMAATRAVDGGGVVIQELSDDALSPLPVPSASRRGRHELQ